MSRLPDTRPAGGRAAEAPKVRRGRPRGRRGVRGRTAAPARAAALLAACVLAIAAPSYGERIPALGPDGTVSIPPFGVGERLVFDIKYGFVSAGTAILGIPEVVSERGFECYRIVSIAESNAFISAFFPVRDVVESYLDTRELVSRRFEKRLREGSFRAHEEVLFDQDRHLAVYPVRGDDRLIPLSLDAQDILTSLYYVRMMDLRAGRSVYIENHADKKNYPLEIKVLRKERIKVPVGEFDCLVVEPVMRAAGLFRHKGSLTIWLTDDRLHLPVQMRSKVVIGSISAVLSEMRLADDTAPGNE